MDDVMTGAEIAEVCNKYPEAKVRFEINVSSGLFGEYKKSACIRGYKILRNLDGNVCDLVFLEDEVVPKNP